MKLFCPFYKKDFLISSHCKNPILSFLYKQRIITTKLRKEIIALGLEFQAGTEYSLYALERWWHPHLMEMETVAAKVHAESPR